MWYWKQVLVAVVMEPNVHGWIFVVRAVLTGWAALTLLTLPVVAIIHFGLGPTSPLMEFSFNLSWYIAVAITGYIVAKSHPRQWALAILLNAAHWWFWESSQIWWLVAHLSNPSSLIRPGLVRVLAYELLSPLCFAVGGWSSVAMQGILERQTE